MYDFDNISLIKDGKRWFPVMGEIHYSRYPKEYWHESLMKMKAGGVDVASTYVIWIHHEEIEGQYDFSGDRDLHLFVKTCKECGIKLWLRIGPWVHGEVRNGGFPDWLLKKDFEVRTNDERYFALVEKWYKRIFKEVEGYFWSENNSENPIIGVQIENEFGHCGGLYDESGEVHMQRLTKMAKEIGFNVPFYTATGWGGARTGGLIPVMGGYCDAPWDPRTVEIEASGNYIFTYERNDHNIGSDYGLGEGITFDSSKFPYLTAELGGGLQMTKHRRTVAKAKDIGAVSLVKLGSGVNLLGFYMYHGGTNPDGKLTSLQESKETGYPNDLPVKSYDFNAPIREYGQIAPVFKELKLLFYFVRDFGSELCQLPALIPEENPLKPDNLKDLRYAFRTDGKKGYVFVNNYVRLKNMPEHKEVSILLPDKKVCLPAFNLLSGDYFFLPFNMEFNGIKILSSKCSVLCTLNGKNTVFYLPESMYSESINSESAVKALATEPFFQFEHEKIGQGEKKQDLPFLILSKKQALNTWKITDASNPTSPTEYLIISENPVIQGTDGSIIFSGRGNEKNTFYVYPDFAFSKEAGKSFPENFIKAGEKNLNLAGKNCIPFVFTKYDSRKTFQNPPEKIIKYSEIPSSDENKLFKLDFSSLLEEFLHHFPESLNDCFVRIFYQGESAQLFVSYKDKKRLIADNFFSGKENCWEIGLKRFINSGIDFSNLLLEISPLHRNDKIYFENAPEFNGENLCTLDSISAEYEWIQKIHL